MKKLHASAVACLCSAGAACQGASPQTLVVSASGYYLNGKVSESMSALTNTLHPADPISIEACMDVKTSFLVQAIDWLKTNGHESYSITAVKAPEQPLCSGQK